MGCGACLKSVKVLKGSNSVFICHSAETMGGGQRSFRVGESGLTCAGGVWCFGDVAAKNSFLDIVSGEDITKTFRSVADGAHDGAKEELCCVESYSCWEASTGNRHDQWKALP